MNDDRDNYIGGPNDSNRINIASGEVVGPENQMAFDVQGSDHFVHGGTSVDVGRVFADSEGEFYTVTDVAFPQATLVRLERNESGSIELPFGTFDAVEESEETVHWPDEGGQYIPH